MTTFKTVGIFGRVKNAGVGETLKALVHYLSELNQNFFVESETAGQLHGENLKTISREKLGEHCDLLIVVGGDGSLLHATHTIIDQNIPVLGINRGSLGFLTDIHPTELKKIQSILQGHYTLEERFLLTATLQNSNQAIHHDDALNEVAIIPDSVPHMIEFEIYIDEQFVCSLNSDGIILATPTGSTAYALSGGGPILHPDLNAIVLVPMFPHSLNSRPIVVNADREIKVKITHNNKTSPRISCDGHVHLSANPGNTVLIRKKEKKLQLIHPIDYNYYEALRSKLHWGKKIIAS